MDSKLQIFLNTWSNSVKCRSCKEVIAYTIMSIEDTSIICRKCFLSGAEIEARKHTKV